MLKKERYNLTLNPKVVAIIDKMASQSRFSRSEYINRILLDYIEEMDEYFEKNSKSGFSGIFGVSNIELNELYSEVS